MLKMYMHLLSYTVQLSIMVTVFDYTNEPLPNSSNTTLQATSKPVDGSRICPTLLPLVITNEIIYNVNIITNN